MSWLATKYAWKCRDTRVKGSVRLVLLAIALRVKKNYTDTAPTSLTALHRLTFLSDDAIRAALKTLEAAGELRRVRRGKYAVYAMARLAGPLFVENPQDAGIFDELETPQDAGISTRRNRGFSGVPAGGVLSSGCTGPNKLTPTTATKSTAVEAFLEWFTATYPTYRGVFFRCASPARTEQAVRELLRLYDRPFLERLAIAMWQETSEPWLSHPNNDRSPIALLHKVTYLERVVRGGGDDSSRRAWCCSHVDPCPHRAACEVKLANPSKYPVKQEATG